LNGIRGAHAVGVGPVFCYVQKGTETQIRVNRFIDGNAEREQDAGKRMQMDRAE